MIKRLFTVLLILIFCSTAGADLIIKIDDSGGSWPMAPYIVTPDTVESGPSDILDWMPAQFSTFCVEITQHFNPGTKYKATINDDIRYLGGTNTDTEALKESVKKTAMTKAQPSDKLHLTSLNIDI